MNIVVDIGATPKTMKRQPGNQLIDTFLYKLTARLVN